MPNTLGHLGVQSLLTRRLLSNSDLKWIYVGCVVPDVPWILQRGAYGFFSGLDPFDLRLYAIVQSSFVFCVGLSLTLALLAANPRRVFAALTLNSFLHLILDGCQTKWGNGVHFLAPFSWRITNWRLFWPESIPTYFLTALGLAFCLWQWKASTSSPFDVCFKFKPKHILLVVLLASYVTLPVVLKDGPYRANNHFVRTLKEKRDRANRYIEFDRVYCRSRGTDAVIEPYGEQITLAGGKELPNGIISVRGRFVDQTVVRVLEVHDHSGWPRDQLSYLGLGLIAAIWTVSGYKTWKTQRLANLQS